MIHLFAKTRKADGFLLAIIIPDAPESSTTCISVLEITSISGGLLKYPYTRRYIL